MRYLLPLGILAFLVALVGIWLMPDPPEWVGAETPGALERVEREMRGEASAPVQTGVREVAQRETAPESAAPVAGAPAFPLTTLTEPGIGVRVVDGATGAALAGVAVWQFPATCFEDSFDFDSTVRSLVARGSAFLEGGWDSKSEVLHYRTDASGRTEVRDLVGSSVLFVEQGERQGFAILGGTFSQRSAEGRGDVMLEVSVPTELRVRAVDALGLPVPFAQLELHAARAPLPTSAMADETGWLYVRALNTLALPLMESNAGRLSIELTPAGRPRSAEGGTAFLEFDLREAWTRDLQGELVVPNHKLHVEVLPAPGEALPSALHGRVVFGKQGRLLNIDKDGRAEVGNLRPGDVVTLELSSAERPGSVRRQVTIEQPNTELRIELESTPKLPEVVARLVDAAGQPIAGETVFVEYRTELNSSEAATPSLFGRFSPIRGAAHVTDAQGELRWSCDELEGLGSVRFEFRFAEQGGLGRVALRNGVEAQRGAALQLGTVELAERQVAAAGRVVDAQGLPVAQATVLAHFVGDPGDPESSLPGRGVTDEKGRFEILSDEERDLEAVSAMKDRATSPRVPSHFGVTDLELVIMETGSIRASLAEGESIRSSEFLLGLASESASEVAPKNGQLTRGEWRGFLIRGRRNFEFEGLRPGLYTVALIQSGQGEDVVRQRWTGVEVVPGKPTVDPRLQDLRLGDLLPTLRFTAVDASGAPITALTVQRASNHIPVKLANEVGAFELVGVDLPERLTFRGAQIRTRALDVDMGFTHIVFERRFEVEFVLPEGVGFKGGLAVGPSEPDVTKLAWPQTEVRLDGDRARISVEDLGAQRLVFVRYSPDGGQLLGLLELEDSPLIGPDDAGRVFQIELTDAERAWLE